MNATIFAHEHILIDVKCSHCGNIISDRWEDHTSGDIKLDISCSSVDILWGENNPIRFNHPVLVKDKTNYQNIEMKWNKESAYRLCRTCQCSLINHIGNFFKQDIIIESILPKEIK